MMGLLDGFTSKAAPAQPKEAIDSLLEAAVPILNEIEETGKKDDPVAAPTQDVIDRIRSDRGRIYGDPHENHANIAKVWTAQLRSRYGNGAPELDAQMVMLMFAGFKVLRASRPVPIDAGLLSAYQDSFPDAHNYLNFAHEETL